MNIATALAAIAQGVSLGEVATFILIITIYFKGKK